MFNQIISMARKNIVEIRRRSDIERWLRPHRRKGTSIDMPFDFMADTSMLEKFQLGEGTKLERDVSVWLSCDAGSDPRLEMGRQVYIGRNSYIGAFQAISIGDQVMIGAYSYITSANHKFTDRNVPIMSQGYTGDPITISSGAWLGTHVVVLPGVTIGVGAIVAAGSVVNKDIPPYEIWGGVPARFIKNRP